MKLSFIFELLLIFILVAFAASAVIGPKASPKTTKNHAVKKYGKVTQHRQAATNATNNRFCSCKMTLCNCCRDFNLPLLNLRGPGCAALQYLQNDQLAISMSFNDRVLTNTTIKGRKPQPICMPLPGGVSKFCGRVYNIGRQGDEFNACLGLELRALSEIEAAIRVSCFKFGPRGLRLEAPQPLPPVDDDDDDEDDDDDDEDDDEDDDDFDFDGEDDSEDNEVDYSVFDDDFIGQYFQGEESESSSSNKKKVTTTTTTQAPLRRLTRKPVRATSRKPVTRRKATPQSVKTTTARAVVTRRRTAASTISRSTTSTTASTTTSTTTTTEVIPVAENEVLPELQSLKQETTSQEVQDEPSTEPTELMVSSSPAISSTDSEQATYSTRANTTYTQADITELTTSIPVVNEMMETTIMSEVKTEPTTSRIAKESEESGEDPIVEVVGDVLEDGISDSEETSEEKATTILTPTTTDETPAESKEVFDDIVDGVVDTFAGDDSDESEKNEKEDDNDDEDESEEDDSEENRKYTRTFKGSRQSRDMWLDRLHW